MKLSPLIIDLDLKGLEMLAHKISAIARNGDLLCLSGELGAGKTTFARYFIHSVFGEDDHTEIPSPSFSLVQTYDTKRFSISHFDFYRLHDPEDVLEIGLEDALASGITLIEWPEKAEDYLPADRLHITIKETKNPDIRRVSLTGYGYWQKKLQRFKALNEFLKKVGWDTSKQLFLQGDASPRAYIRLKTSNKKTAILMDAPRQPDGPPIRNGKAYSEIAHLAEDMHAFVAIGTHLKYSGIHAPEIYAYDLQQGLLLIEDLGDEVFGHKIAEGADIFQLYKSAVQVLLHLRGVENGPDLSHVNGTPYNLPIYDTQAFGIEVELLPDWYWQAQNNQAVLPEMKQEFVTLWERHFQWLAKQPMGLIMRDFHSPNLIWLEEAKGLDKVGVIDFQDAVYGPCAYDLVSLLQDARLDISEDIEQELLEYYCYNCQDVSGFEKADFLKSYAILGAQRNTKILGIFARLALRDSKYGYLEHIPRIWAYLERNLQHPDLVELRDWYDLHFPKNMRISPPDVA